VTETLTAAADGLTEDQKKKEQEKKKPAWWKVLGAVLWKRVKAVAFVVAAFAFWYLFVSLSRIVMQCETVSWWPFQYRCAPLDLTTLTHRTWTDTVILLSTLIIAIWAARRLVFPPDD